MFHSLIHSIVAPRFFVRAGTVSFAYLSVERAMLTRDVLLLLWSVVTLSMVGARVWFCFVVGLTRAKYWQLRKQATGAQQSTAYGIIMWYVVVWELCSF